MQLEKPKLFPQRKGFMVAMGILISLLFIRLIFEYQSYKNFIIKPFYYTYASVITAYEKSKNERVYTVLKLKSEEGFTFYTTTHKKESFKNKRLRLQIFPNSSISFKDYLGTFYVKSKIKFQEKSSYIFKNTVLKKVASQHQNEALKTFYNAIFFATPLVKELRKKVSMLGVSHLVALSGFHLGILWSMVYGVLFLLYRPMQQKFFPYRHRLFDVGLITIILLAIYVWFVGSPDSLVRSYAMLLVGWGVVLFGMELVSFTFLTTIVLTLVVLFPSLLVSLSFWFSIAGVFYIFLLIHYTKQRSKWLITLVIIPLGIFILMLPIVHSIFGVTTLYQLFSPLLSILFMPFYIAAIFLHLFGMGAWFDERLLWLFSLPKESNELFLPLWSMVAYVALSIVSIWNKKMFYILIGIAILYMFYLFISIE